MNNRQKEALEYQNNNLNAAPYDALLAGYQYAVDKVCEFIMSKFSIQGGRLYYSSVLYSPEDIVNDFKQVMEQ